MFRAAHKPVHSVFVVAAVAAVSLGGLALPAQAATASVSDIASLQVATSTCADGDTVTLDADISSAGSAITTNCVMTLNLNDHSLSLGQVVLTPGTTLTIDGGTNKTGALTAITTEEMTAAIRNTGANLIINSGTVTATAAQQPGDFMPGGAGIGGDFSDASGNGGNTTINGGTVIASGGDSAAGIGGRSSSPGGNTTINGGTVEVVGGLFAPGIGGGNGGEGGTTTIGDGAQVTATGGMNSPGIGGGPFAGGATVTIDEGADVTVAGGANQDGGLDISAIGGGNPHGGPATAFGTLSVSGTLRIPASANLTIPNGDSAQVTPTGVITGPDDETDGGQIYGPGTLANAGSITLSDGKVIDASNPAVVTLHDYAITFDSQGGSSETARKVFAKSFSDGARTLPAPTRSGHTFDRWDTDADGEGEAVDADTALSGSSAGTPLPITLYAIWSPSTPTLTGDPTATGQVGTSFTYTPTLVGSPGPTVTLTAGTLPSGLSLDATTGAITGTPSEGSGGTYAITLTADNDVEPNATLSVAITINEAPELHGAAAATGQTGQAFSYMPTIGAGFPAPTVTMPIGDLPEGLSLNASTGKISGIPTTSGEFPIALRAANDIDSSFLLNITITINERPMLAGALTATGQTGQAFSYMPSVVRGFPAPTVTMPFGDLPEGLSLNASTGKISGIPTTSGEFPIALRASNGISTPAELDVVITIATSLIAGLAPTISGTVQEGKTLTANPGPVTPASTFAYVWKANGKNISGATNPTLKLGKAQAGRKITVSITASSPGYVPQTASSASTGLVSSPHARILLTTKAVKKGTSFGLIATGFKPGQKYRVWLGGKKTYTGRADAHGTVSRTAKFKSSVKPGTRRVRVSGYNSKGKRTFTVLTRVTYKK